MRMDIMRETQSNESYRMEFSVEFVFMQTLPHADYSLYRAVFLVFVQHA